MVFTAVSFVVFAVVGASLCAEGPCPVSMAYCNLMERLQRYQAFFRKHREDGWRVVKLVLSVLAFAVVSQLMLLQLGQVPSSAEKADWVKSAPASCVIR